MPRFSKRSKDRLDTCHPDLVMIFNTVVTVFDCTVICGHRGKEAQGELVRTGHSQLLFPHSKHNIMPSMAVDVAPYPIDWRDRERFTYFAGYVLGTARMLYMQALITHNVRWGGDWDRDWHVHDNRFDDLVHFELTKAVP